VSFDEEYRNPIDKKTYVAEGGWTAYLPESPRPEEPGKKVKTVEIMLLTSQDALVARTTVEAVVDFVREAERLAEVAFGSSGGQFRVLVQFDCTSTGHEVKLAHQGDVAQELLQGYYEALASAPKLPVRDGEVSFQLELSVSP